MLKYFLPLALATLPLCAQPLVPFLGAGNGSSSFATPTVTGCSIGGSPACISNSIPGSGFTQFGVALTPAAGQYLRVGIAIPNVGSYTVSNVFASAGTIASWGATTNGCSNAVAGTTVLVSSTDGGGSGMSVQLTLVTNNSLAGASAMLLNPGSGYVVPPVTGSTVAGGSNPAVSCTNASITFSTPPTLNGTSLGAADFSQVAVGQAVGFHHLANIPSGVVGISLNAGIAASGLGQLVVLASTAPSASSPDVHAGQAGSASTSQTSTSATSTQNGDLWLGGCSERTSGSYTSIGGTWTSALNSNNGSAATVFGWQIQSTLGALAFTATSSTSSVYACAVIADKT